MRGKRPIYFFHNHKRHRGRSKEKSWWGEIPLQAVQLFEQLSSLINVTFYCNYQPIAAFCVIFTWEKTLSTADILIRGWGGAFEFNRSRRFTKSQNSHFHEKSSFFFKNSTWVFFINKTLFIQQALYQDFRVNRVPCKTRLFFKEDDKRLLPR